MLKKKESEAWQIATRISKRKGMNKVPVRLSEDGQNVTWQSLIRGNTWTNSLQELKELDNSKRRQTCLLHGL